MNEFLNTGSNQLVLIYTLILGVIIGSFLNTLIYRLPIMLGFVEKNHNFKKFNLCVPRSFCDKCYIKIPFYLNIPIISYLILKGKCFSCKSSISFKYPAIEILTGLVFIWLTLFINFSYELIFISLLSCALIVLAFIDLKYLVLPNTLTYSLICFGLLINFFYSITPFLSAILGCSLGYLGFLFIEKVFYLIKKSEGLGRGDAKLVAAIGAWVGLNYLPVVILLAACTGIIFFISLILVRKIPIHQSLNLPIPFGAFLASSCIIIIPLIKY